LKFRIADSNNLEFSLIKEAQDLLICANVSEEEAPTAPPS
jgi:hypothetical protein